MVVSMSYDPPSGPRVQTKRSVRKRQPGEVYFKVKSDTVPLTLKDTTVWVDIPSNVNWSRISSASRYIQFRIENNP